MTQRTQSHIITASSVVLGALAILFYVPRYLNYLAQPRNLPLPRARR